MNPRVEELTAGFEKKESAGADQINALTASLGFGLPEDYLEFVRLSNGGEGFIGEISYLMLWPIEEILERNQRLEIGIRAPSLLLFGSNGGDAAYAFDATSRNPSNMPIVEIPYLDIGEEGGARFRGSTFIEFLEQLASEK